jgi:hypothetical protein
MLRTNTCSWAGRERLVVRPPLRRQLLASVLAVGSRLRLDVGDQVAQCDVGVQEVQAPRRIRVGCGRLRAVPGDDLQYVRSV